MANRPQVDGWQNINLNKPEEYSSEFTQDGLRYANVTNVNTGQRQLYLVSGLGGTPLTQRTLITSTNSNGDVTRGEGYDDFSRVYGRDKLQNAENTNKQQSLFIIERAATTDEKERLGNTNEYKSLKNKGSGNSISDTLLSTIPFDTSDISLGTPVPIIGPPVIYPNDIANTKQDRIKFTAVSIQLKNLQEPLNYNPVSGNVYISIQGPIVDQNAVSWGENDLPLAQLAMGEVAKGASEGGAQGATDAMGKLAQGALEGLTEETKNAAVAGIAANNMSIFTRATQKVFNPNIELIFEKPTLRSFTFNFKMSARDVDEARDIKKIIRFFKYHSAVKDDSGLLFLKSPDVFWIEYQKGNGELHESLNLIAPGEVRKKACALQNMSVNYTPLGSYMTFEDRQATMVQYDLSLSFKEITPIYQSDYEDEIVAKNHPIGY